MVLETERLLLRPLMVTDWRAYCRAKHDLEMQRYERPPRNNVGAIFLLFVSVLLGPLCSSPNRPALTFAICLKSTGQFIGSIVLVQTWLGFAVARREWGKGYVTEAAEKFLEYIFTATRHETVHVGCYAGNKASFRVIQKLGFVPSKKTSTYLKEGYSEYQELSFSLTEKQYMAQRRAVKSRI